MFDQFPDKWWWSMTKPLPTEGLPNGKKKRWKYSLYVSTGEMLATPTFMSVEVGADHQHSLYVEAMEAMRAQTETRINLLLKEKGDNKKLLDFLGRQLGEINRIMFQGEVVGNDEYIVGEDLIDDYKIRGF